MKAVNHDLRGLDAYVVHGLSRGIYFPLMCVVDFLGHRLLACSRLPIHEHSLVYGCCNASSRDMIVRKSNPRVNDVMEVMANKLKLKGHYTGR